MKVKLDTIWIKQQEITKLFSYSDKLDPILTNKLINSIYKALPVNFVLNLMMYVSIFSAIHLTSSTILDKGTPLPFYLSSLILVVFITNSLESFYTNYFINHNSGVLVFKKINTLKDEFSKILDKNLQINFNEVYSTARVYWYDWTEVTQYFIQLALTVFTLSIAPVDPDIKKIFLGLSALITIVFVISGYLFTKASTSNRTKLLNNELLLKRDVALRVSLPWVSNIFSQTIFPFAIIMLSAYRLNSVIPQVTYLAAIASYSWGIVSRFENFVVTKKNLTLLLEGFNKLATKFVINEEGFQKQCKMSKPSQALIAKSKKNKSLVLKSFVPKCITNGEKSTRNITFEFMPGAYQLTGLNGVGKTTLLQSLGLSEETKVEYCCGEAAYFGKPLFNCEDTLVEHRKKVRYLGKNTGADKEKLNGKAKKFLKYQQIEEFMEMLTGRHSDSYSEGEKAIYLIINALEKLRVSEGNIIIIDELISRIYEDEEIKLRTAVTNTILEQAHNTNSIIIIVDHVIKLSGVTQVVMSYPAALKIKA